jgi:hypothetical protein
MFDRELVMVMPRVYVVCCPAGRLMLATGTCAHDTTRRVRRHSRARRMRYVDDARSRILHRDCTSPTAVFILPGQQPSSDFALAAGQSGQFTLATGTGSGWAAVAHIVPMGGHEQRVARAEVGRLVHALTGWESFISVKQ